MSSIDIFFKATIFAGLIAGIYYQDLLIVVIFSASIIYGELLKISSKTIRIDASDIGLNPKMMETIKRVMDKKKAEREENVTQFFGKND